ncbi:DUF4142 domain-containing protein [Pedobacter nanyangensis]|uniref:DUF4142 domain-containing protein n=1 Tax=Pedobacter nanyangensis TaxID=1562389 RepID=UPI000DE47B9F|nr:DUF4142 domain-containing protein [Pedobacter nanyangensis]
MKNISTLSVALGLSLTLACNSAEREHRDGPVGPSDSVIDATTKAHISTADVNVDGAEKAFIISIYSQSLYTTELATIAAKSQMPALRSLAKDITPSYQKLMADMEKIAKGKGMLLERNLSESQQKELDAIKELASPTLDQQVLQKLQTLQAAFTNLFKERQNLYNSDLKQYAGNALKVIQQQQAPTAKLMKLVNETGSQSTRPGEVATP